MTPFVRRLLHFALLYTCVEGLVINMTFPSKLGFVVKDAALVLAYFLFFADNQGQTFGSLSRFRLPLALFVVVMTTYLVMPLGLGLLARSVGWKMRLLYIPIMFMAYRYVRSFEDYRRLAMILIFAAIPVSIFGIYLYFVGPSFLRSIGGTYSAVVYSTTGFWRVPGTFTSPGQYGLYLTFNALLCMSLIIWGRSTVRDRVVIWASLGVSIVAMLASGSRTPIILVAACAGLTIVSLRRVGRLISISVVLYAVFAVGFATLGGGVADRVDSIASAEHVARFQTTYFGQLFLPQVLAEPIGKGLGIATIGARHFTEFSQIVFIESYLGLVGIETGVLGLVSILWLSAAVVVVMWRQRAVMKDSGDSAAPWHVMALFACMVVALLPVGTPLDAAPGNVYFWLALGICAKLYDLERWRRAQGLGAIPAGRPMQPAMLSPYPPVPPPRPGRFQ
jgi:hypothetical protein